MHVIDLEVLDHCPEAIAGNAEALVMPWRPHRDFQPGPPLSELCRSHPLLRRLDGEGRLLWYNLVSAPEPNGSSPVIRARYFSAAAALDLLRHAGAREVRSLGVDGGGGYSREFTDLEGTTRLAGGHASFDVQFRDMGPLLRDGRVRYGPLGVDLPVRVYVGTTAPQALALAVLAHSIRRHARMTVEIVPLHEAGLTVPLPRDRANQPRTPFSFHRFLIPALADHRGRAIYLDSDMLVFRDIGELWTWPFDGADVLSVREPEGTGRPSQFGVMVLDCGALTWRIEDIVARLDRGELSYEQLMFDLAVAGRLRRDLPDGWNSLERFESGRTSLLHYTDMARQPWLRRRNPLGSLWLAALQEALVDGTITRAEVEEEVRRGHVRPSLLYDMEYTAPADRLVRRALDRFFTPPHESLHEPRRSARERLRAAMSARVATAFLIAQAMRRRAG